MNEIIWCPECLHRIEKTYPNQTVFRCPKCLFKFEMVYTKNMEEFSRKVMNAYEKSSKKVIDFKEMELDTI